MKRSESEILNDPEIWAISDSDDDLAGSLQDGGNKRADQEEVASRGNSDAEAKTDDEGQQHEEMARYLVEQAPMLGGARSGSSNIGSL